MARGDSNTLSGAVRSPSRRSHNARPYARHDVTNGAAAPPSAFPSGRLTQSTSSLARSGSESSLFSVSGLKSMFSRPLAWLATPTKAPAPAPSGTKRDHNSPDPEDPASPSERRASKRARRASPEKQKRIAGPYEPSSSSVAALPPLPHSLSRGTRASLPASTSMPYLDPPKSLLDPSSPRASTLRPRGSMARSSRMDFGSIDEFGGVNNATPDRRRTLGPSSGEKESWSPWQQQRTPRQSIATSSPFGQQTSTLAPRGIGRSQTLTNVREDSVASDVNMGSGSMRAGSGFGTFGGGRSRLLPKSASMRFDSVAEDDDDRMSVVSDRNDFFAERAAHRASLTPVSRLSALPSHSKPVAEPKLLYVPGRGFVKAAEATAAAKPAPKNDADRILEALEASRQASTSALPPSMVGASTRQLRKAIAIPLATSASASERKGHRADWLSHGGGVSAAISPYGRRRAIDIQAREQRRVSRATAESETSDMEMDASASVVSSRRRSTRSRSMMSISESGATSDTNMSDVRSPSPPRKTTRRTVRSRGKSPAQDETPRTLRRSTRLRTVEENPTPSKPAASPRRSKRVDKSPAADATPRASRRRKATTPPPERDSSPEPAPAPSVPVIKETAPSPASKSTYQVRDDTAPRERSSLRTGATKNRQHQGAASYASSRATSPGAGAGSGRFSARDEDLPDMEELEKLSKATTASFSGFSMPLFGQKKDGDKAKEPSSDGQLSSRIAMQPPPAAQPGGSLSIPASSSSLNRGGLTGRIGNTRPRASSPLAASSFIAEPDSPQTKDAEKKADSVPVAPPTGAFFSLAPSGASTPGLTPPATSSAPAASDFFAPPKSPVKVVNMGLGKPSTPPSGGIPNFFGGGTTTPTAPPPAKPAFDFGLKAGSKPTKEADAAAPATFCFDKPADPATNATQPFSFGAATEKAADKAAPKPFSFGPASGSTAPAADKPVEAAKPFSFGPASGSTTPATDKPVEAAKPFSFGTPTEAPKTGFNFGSNSNTPAATPAADAAPKGFAFGAPSAPADKPADAPKAPFSFGQTVTPADKPAEAAKSFSFGSSTPAADKPADAPKPFSFGAPAASAEKSADAPKPFGFGAPSAPTPAPATNGSDKPSFSFGAPSSAPASTSFGNGSAAPAPASGSFSFGGEKKADAPASSPFAFGAPSSTTAPGGFGKPNGDAPKPFSFGAGAAAPAPAPASGGFNFGANTSSSGFGTTPSAPAAGFGVTSPTTSTTSTGFGGFGSQGGSAPTSASKPAFSFDNTTPAPGGFGRTPAPAIGAGFGSTPDASPGFGAPAPATGGFGGFGASSTPAQPGSRPTSSSAAPAFGFGAPAAPTSGASTPTSTNASFQFGAAAPAVSSFQFGSAPAPAAGGFSFGAPAAGAAAPAAPAPRFGSPAPDGFSMGIGAEPGSPGGRKIKPLRRGAAKR